MADLLDVLTLMEGMAAVNMPKGNSDHDDDLAMQITAVSRMLDAACGPIVQRTITAEVHDASSVVRLTAPVASVSLVRAATGGSVSTLNPVSFGGTTDGYRIDLATGQLRRSIAGSVAPWGSGQVEVTYVAGRFANTGAVDARFKMCASLMLSDIWKQMSAAWAQTPEFFDALNGDQVPSFPRNPRRIIAKHARREHLASIRAAAARDC